MTQKNLLITGASSLSGSWFIQKLAEQNHKITATFTKHDLTQYDGIRKNRVEQLLALPQVTPAWNTHFGSDKFIELIANNNFDTFCNHGCEMTNYQSSFFDPVYALKENTFNLHAVLEKLIDKGCQQLIFTGTTYEPYEGTGSSPGQAFSPYGLSKHLTYEVFKLECRKLNLRLKKFIIPNPFGVFEHKGFTTYLFKTWLSGKIPTLKNPYLVRDNIPVCLLADCYAKYTTDNISDQFINHINHLESKLSPSGYIESLEQFTKRNLECLFNVRGQQYSFEATPAKQLTQEPLDEPFVRTNLTPAQQIITNWDEQRFWQQFVEFHLKLAEKTKEPV